MVVHHSEAAHGDGEDLSKFFEPMFDPGFAVEGPLSQQEGLPHGASDAVVPAGYGGIDEVGAGDSHGRSPGMMHTA